jgi:hypothetical protein
MKDVPHIENLQEENKPLISDEVVDKYTSMFWQRKPSELESIVVFVCLFMVYGLFEGYQKSLNITFQSLNISMSDLSMWSLNTYPMLFRILWSPIIDRYYFRSFGKSKTYLLSSGLLMVCILVWMGLHMDDLVKQRRIGLITVICFCLIFTTSFYLIAASIYVLTLFKGPNKTKGTFVRVIATNFGEILGYYIFIPLNSETWVKEHITGDIEPNQSISIYKHKYLLLGAACILLPTLLYLTFFMAEKKIKGESGVTLTGAIKFIPKILMRKNTLLFASVVFSVRFFSNFTAEILNYQLIHIGIPKETIVLIDAFLFPVQIATSFLCHRLLSKNRILQTAHLLTFIWLLDSISKYLLIKYLTYGNNISETSVAVQWIFINQFFYMFAIPGNLIVAYVGNISDVRVGSTMMTTLLTINDSVTNLSKTFGLKIGSWMNFDSFVILFKVVQLVILLLFYRVSKYLDRLDIKDFAVYVSDEEYNELKKYNRDTLILEDVVRKRLQSLE